MKTWLAPPGDVEGVNSILTNWVAQIMLFHHPPGERQVPAGGYQDPVPGESMTDQGRQAKVMPQFQGVQGSWGEIMPPAFQAKTGLFQTGAPDLGRVTVDMAGNAIEESPVSIPQRVQFDIIQRLSD